MTIDSRRDESATFLLLLQVEHRIYLDGVALAEIAQTVGIVDSLALDPNLRVPSLSKQG